MDAIKAEILNSLRLFIKNMPDDVLEDLINDAITDVSEFINYVDDGISVFPEACKVIIKDLVKIHANKLGAEGLTNQSYSNRSENYSNDLPEEIKRKLMRHRKLRK